MNFLSFNCFIRILFDLKYFNFEKHREFNGNLIILCVWGGKLEETHELLIEMKNMQDPRGKKKNKKLFSTIVIRIKLLNI